MEVMSDFLPTDLCEDLICCSICYETFSEKRTPKALPCLHSFCVICLKGSIESYKKTIAKNPKASTPTSFPCPLCKDMIKIPKDGVDGFKDDFRIKKISEVLTKTKISSQILPSQNPVPELKMNIDGVQNCEVCKFFKKSSHADLYCLECNKLLCKSCSEKHLNTPIAKDHKMVDATEARSTDTVCSLHAPEVVKYYCRDCGQSLCPTCTFTDEHSNHKVVNLEEESKRSKEILGNLVASCKTKFPQLKENVRAFDHLENKLQAKEKNAHKAVLLRTVEEIARIRKEQDKMEKELQALCRDKYLEIQNAREKISKHVDEAVEYCQLTDTIVERAQGFQVVSAFSEMQGKLQAIAAFKCPELPDETAFVDFGKYDILAEQFEGELDKDDIPEHDSIYIGIKRGSSQTRICSSGKAELKAEMIRRIGKKGSGDGEFNFPSGVAIFDNGDIAIADLHNSRIQIFDRQGNFKHKFSDMGFKPCGIAITHEGDIAVTDTQNHVNCIKLFDTTGTRKASFGHGEFDYPFCIAVDSKGRFVVSDPAKNEILILDTDGNIHRRFITRTKFAFYLTVNSKDQVVVSDWYHHCIRIYDQNGLLLKKMGTGGFKEGQLMIPLGIATDTNDTIMFLDCKCQRLTLFSADGRFIKHILEGKEHGIEYSRAIALSRDGRLVISHGDNKRIVPNEVRIYQIRS